MSRTRFALVVEYAGTRYHGFQWQPGVATIQAELEKALERLSGERRRFVCASRTDAGVHAEGQVVGFQSMRALSKGMLIQGMNYYLPEDVAVRDAYQTDNEFNVRRDAVSREYRYVMLNRPTRSPLAHLFSCLVRKRLDLERMREACQLLTGRQDFASFATGLVSGEPTVRDVHEATVEREGDYVVFRIRATSFLRHQVRNTVGALIRLGLGKMYIEELRAAIAAKRPGAIGPAAPAEGLILRRVSYERGLVLMNDEPVRATA